MSHELFKLDFPNLKNIDSNSFEILKEKHFTETLSKIKDSNQSLQEYFNEVANIYMVLKLEFLNNVISSQNIEEVKERISSMLKKSFKAVDSSDYNFVKNETQQTSTKSSESMILDFQRQSRRNDIIALINKFNNIDLRGILKNAINDPYLKLEVAVADFKLCLSINKSIFLSALVNDGRLDLFLKYHLINSFVGELVKKNNLYFK